MGRTKFIEAAQALAEIEKLKEALEMWTQPNAKLQAENAELKKANYWQVEKIETWQEKVAK